MTETEKLQRLWGLLEALRFNARCYTAAAVEQSCLDGLNLIAPPCLHCARRVFPGEPHTICEERAS